MSDGISDAYRDRKPERRFRCWWCNSLCRWPACQWCGRKQ